MVVFRYPEEPEVSHIKRLVGLPGETVRVWYGDIYIKKPGTESFLPNIVRLNTSEPCR
ncbi:MAG: S26 family signal peptidase [Isosphaeraceae bacterium]